MQQDQVTVDMVMDGVLVSFDTQEYVAKWLVNTFIEFLSKKERPEPEIIYSKDNEFAFTLNNVSFISFHKKINILNSVCNN